MQLRILMFLLILNTKYGYGLYTFFKTINTHARTVGTRRVFGGDKAMLKEFPHTCLLMDEISKAKCTGTIISPTFALTAAHCIDKSLRLIRYNTRSVSEDFGNVDVIEMAFRHPDYHVTEADEGKGLDVTHLKHDVGLVMTMQPMTLKFNLSNPLIQMRSIPPAKLKQVNVDVVGFGRTEIGGKLGEELFTAKLLLQPCERASWVNCVCGAAKPGARSQGVCSGDSGGPVFYNGTQVGVTSMGPLDCIIRSDPAPGATSVFTEIYDYIDIINATIHNLKAQKMMIPITLAAHPINPTASVNLAGIVLSLGILKWY